MSVLMDAINWLLRRPAPEPDEVAARAAARKRLQEQHARLRALDVQIEVRHSDTRSRHGEH